MANPFQPNDRVQTKVRGAIIGAVVRLAYKDEVQVRTDDKALLWRTAKTVWYPGAQLPQPPKDTTTSVQMTQAGVDSNGVHSSATPTADAVISPTPSTPATSDTTVPDSAPIANAALAQPGVVQPAQNLTSCSGGDTPVAKRKMRRKKK
jgi:hypothetical protein